MVDLAYVKKRKTRKKVAIVSAISGCVVAIFCIVAFLGQAVGSFTVTLQQSDVKLKLSDNNTFDDPLDSLLVVDICTFRETASSRLDKTYGNLLDVEVPEVTNNDDRFLGRANDGSMAYFAYTFYVRNESSKTAQYDLTLNRTSTRVSIKDVDNIMRIRCYENKVVEEGAQTHNYDTYSRWNETTGEPELINSSSTEYCNKFVKDDLYVQRHVMDLQPYEIYRYTFVIWLEGTDPDAYGEPPSGTINMGITINAYEND